MNKEHGQNIYENGIDSIERAIDLIIYDYDLEKSSILKQAFTLLHHGLELLLKTRLMNIHPSLVWEDLDLFPKLDARTIGSEKSLKRLVNIGGLNISEETLRIFTQLRKIRNSIEHFSWSINQNSAEKLFAKSLFHIDIFCMEHLDISILAYKDRKEGIVDQLYKKNHFIKICYQENKGSIEKAQATIKFICEHCRAVISSQNEICSKCGTDNQDLEDFINDLSIPSFDDFDDDIPF